MSSTFAKGLKLLETLCLMREPIGISELAVQADMNLSAVQRLLSTLVELGYAEQDPKSRRYSATLMSWEIGSQVLRDHAYLRAVHPILRAAAQDTGFTAYFILNNAPFVTYFDKVEGVNGLTHSSVLGTSVPIMLTAAGLAIISFLDDDQFQALASPGVRGGSHFPGIDLPSIQHKVQEVRQKRYAVSESGFRKAVNSVAAPVWAADGRVCGSIAITADENELKTSDFTIVGSKVIKWAEQATTILGGQSYPRSFYA